MEVACREERTGGDRWEMSYCRLEDKNKRTGGLFIYERDEQEMGWGKA